MLGTFEKISGREITYKIEMARKGDIAELYACCNKISEELGWSAKLGLEDICESAWKWHKNYINSNE